MKRFYGFAWFLLIAAVFYSLLTSAFNPMMLVVFSLIALALVYAFALWSVIGNDPGAQAE